MEEVGLYIYKSNSSTYNDILWVTPPLIILSNLASLRSQITKGSIVITSSNEDREQLCFVPFLRGRKSVFKSLLITEATVAFKV